MKHRIDYDLANKEMATISSFVTVAEDHVCADGHYRLDIFHVKGFHGKGFVAHIRSFGSMRFNSDIFYGTDEEIYRQAVACGKEQVEEFKREDAEKMKETNATTP